MPAMNAPSTSLPVPEQDGNPGQIAVFALALGVALIAFLAASWPIDASLFDNQYHPSRYDAFYHASIIRELITRLPDLLELDRKLHPLDDGSWIALAWGYDYLMAIITTTVLAINPDLRIDEILAYIPACWAILNSLLLFCLCRGYRLKIMPTTVVTLTFALSPTSQTTHLIGNIDHHFIELSFILAILLSGLSWINRPDSIRRALLAGAVLGLSGAFHIALFVMYIPLAIFLFVIWVHGELPNFGRIPEFATATLIASILAVLPSAHFRAFEFHYYFTSWFHIYWAATFCAAVIFMRYRAFSRLNCLVLTGLLLVAALPIRNSLLHGSAFLLADLPEFETLDETYSVFAYLFSGDLGLVYQVYLHYGGILFLAPFAMILLFDLARKRPATGLLFCLISSTFGLIFVLLQLRFAYHGSYALLLPLFILYQYQTKLPRQAKPILLTIVALSALGPITQLGYAHPLGGQPGYRGLYPFYQAIGQLCQQAPGVLLAHPDEGHYLRYHTNCKIVTSNLMVTPRDFEYRVLALKMFSQTMPEIFEQYPWVDYIYVRREGGFAGSRDPVAERVLNHGLRADILIDENVTGAQVLADLRLKQGLYLRLLTRGQETMPEADKP